MGVDVPPETSLNEYIRNYANLKGTKFMCLEGGCGACIVSIKRPNPITSEDEIFAVNSVSDNALNSYFELKSTTKILSFTVPHAHILLSRVGYHHH